MKLRKQHHIHRNKNSNEFIIINDLRILNIEKKNNIKEKKVLWPMTLKYLILIIISLLSGKQYWLRTSKPNNLNQNVLVYL